jgi:hypothetical protein
MEIGFTALHIYEHLNFTLLIPYRNMCIQIFSELQKNIYIDIAGPPVLYV